MAGLLSAVETERDQRLLADHREGDPAAFAQLYATHYDRLLRFVRSRVRDWHLAEEITQDAFVRAYGAVAHLKDGSRFYPWLTVIAQRLAIDAFRRTGRVSPVAEFGELGVEPAADENVIAASEAEALAVALGRVRERHRQVLRWQTEGLSYEDIAQRLNAPLTTVPPLLFRARQALKREYLALTEPERLSAVPVLGAFLAWSRRWRARGVQVASWVPEPAMFTAQFATVVLVVGGVFAGADPGNGVRFQDPASPAVAAQPSHGNVQHSGVSLVGSSASEAVENAEPGRSSGALDRAAPSVGLGGPGREQAERFVERAPYRLEAGPVGIGLDPEGDVTYLRDMAGAAPR